MKCDYAKIVLIKYLAKKETTKMTNQTLYQLINEVKSYGKLYDRELRTKEIAKMIRKELKPLIKLGFKFSVKTDQGMMHSSIRIKILVIPESFVLYNPYYDSNSRWINSWENGKDPRPFLTDNGKQLVDYIKSIGEQWNYNNNDLMTDYFDENYMLFIVGNSGVLL